MSQIEIPVPALHAGQRQIDAEALRFNVICCGRRFGKSVLSRRRLVRVVLQTGAPVAYFAPTYKMLADYWRETIAEVFPALGKSNAQERRIEFLNGGTLDMWSLDEPNAARGRKYAKVAIDEAAMVARLEEAWQEVIRPTLSDLLGTADFYSTPKGRNFFWQLSQRGQDPSQTEWRSWQMPTTANPFIDASEVEAARLELPERVFQQEYLAAFLDDGNGIFRRVQESATALPQAAAIAGHQYVIGVDWGKLSDFTVLSVIDLTTGEQCYLDRFNQIDYAVQMQRLQVVVDKFKPTTILAERNSMGEPLIESCARAGMPIQPFVTTNTTKAEIIDSLSLAFERGTLKILPDPVQLGELQAYEATRLPSGLLRYSAPEGLHDDTVMALALAQYAGVMPRPWWSDKEALKTLRGNK